MDFTNGMKKAFLASVGAAATTAEVTKDILEKMSNTRLPDSEKERARSIVTVLFPSFGMADVTTMVQISSPQNWILVFNARSDSFIV